MSGKIYTKKELGSLEITMNETGRIAEESKKKYYDYLREMKQNCKYEWIAFGFDYKCSICDKLDY